jgi:hypothetical protein
MKTRSKGERKFGKCLVSAAILAAAVSAHAECGGIRSLLLACGIGEAGEAESGRGASVMSFPGKQS